MYGAREVSEHRAICELATQPYSTAGGVGVRLFQAHGQQIVTTWIPRIETEYLLTRSMYIKMYIHANYSSFLH